MKLWLISRTTDIEFDTYDSAVVAAATEDSAKDYALGYGNFGESIECKYIGEADASVKAGVICASFNAG